MAGPVNCRQCATEISGAYFLFTLLPMGVIYFLPAVFNCSHRVNNCFERIFWKKMIWKFWKFLFQLQWKYIWIFFKTGMFLSTCKQKFGNRWFFHHMRWFIADLKKIYEKYQNSSLMISFIFIDFLFNLLRCVPHQADVKMYQSICYLECNTFKTSNNERFLGCVCHKSETEWRATWQEYANIKIRVCLSAKMNNFS